MVCPDRNQLSAYSLGLLADEELEAVADHVDICAECETIVSDIEKEHQQDPLIAAINSQTFISPHAHEEELARVMQASQPFDSPSPRVTINLPEQFGKYRIMETLGIGAMGAVYLANDTELKRDVAIKVPHKFIADTMDVADRFMRESVLIAQLNHPNICPIYDVGKIEEISYLTMPYVPGETLDRHIAKNNLTHQQIAKLVKTVAEAMDEVHSQGILHRDLKLSNIIVNRQGVPIITDFGLARSVDPGLENHRLTQTGVLMGSLSYMSPEQSKGDKELGRSSDIYSLGVILFELLTGTLPFEGSTGKVISKIINDPAPAPSSRGKIDFRLDEICLRAMEKKPEKRWASMGEMADALESYLTGINGITSKIVGYPLQKARKAKRLLRDRKDILILCCASVVLLLSLSYIGLSPNSPPSAFERPVVYGDVVIIRDLLDVRILIDESDRTEEVFGKNSSLTVGKSILLTVGPHHITIMRGDLIVDTIKVNIVAGENPPILLQSRWDPAENRLEKGMN